MTLFEELEPEIPGTLYEKMAEHLTERIKRGELRPNYPLPNERRLAEEYGVSLGTARHATRLLKYRGLVITVRSKGTYVTTLATSSSLLSDAAVAETSGFLDNARPDDLPRNLASTARQGGWMTHAVPAFTAESTRAVLDTACRIAGVDWQGATLMRLGENALYRLASAPIVVRIAGGWTTGRRSRRKWQ
ncbi:DNA-binding transcriptional regulator YhcF (GntR family) [Amycolatopsis bartoniae]|uniref:HTH gntR-type domain-containing protein n=1 Tax=Amycolatopsis bartoniae TaxID=941986 RepID=A0A8H9J6H9_9PSEU|nr:winged helix-turn-helix domain-containing protein [Amycolatopsis bartoniae]MBB2934132.1 DNA-binding transcriptional regulator YhcF (GntR family) [Amycolatopsis bartoniae]TVT05513.1 winged helix-turn-helix transcriptional regulator [Amycolatopsis bartoniae]GHF84121.1 hypothetical protein GCM10017566_67670 [Amycolatopsis bartoniae]